MDNIRGQEMRDQEARAKEQGSQTLGAEAKKARRAMAPEGWGAR